MARYQKKATIVDATQMVEDRELGVLGTIESGDWLLVMHDASMHSMTSADFSDKYTTATQSAALTGDQWE